MARAARPLQAWRAVGSWEFFFGDGPEDYMRFYPNVANPAPDLADALPKMRDGWRVGYAWAGSVFRRKL